MSSPTKTRTKTLREQMREEVENLRLRGFSADRCCLVLAATFEWKKGAILRVWNEITEAWQREPIALTREEQLRKSNLLLEKQWECYDQGETTEKQHITVDANGNEKRHKEVIKSNGNRPAVLRGMLEVLKYQDSLNGQSDGKGISPDLEATLRDFCNPNTDGDEGEVE